MPQLPRPFHFPPFRHHDFFNHKKFKEMPRLLKRKDKKNAENQPIPCDFTASTLNVMVEEQVSQQELQARCVRYYDYLAALQPPQETIMLRASNFTTESVLQLIQSNPTSTFLRVYYGINEFGEHGLFMGAVTEQPATAGSTSTAGITASETTTEDPTYVEECCACPPRGNCQDDTLLVWP
jgi:hypothetical protein